MSGLPQINIAFKAKATGFAAKGLAGIVAIILRDSAVVPPTSVGGISSIPTALSAENKAYIERAFLGYVAKPRQVLIYVLTKADADIAPALAWLSTQLFDYVCLPHDCTPVDKTALVAWIKAQRGDNRTYRAVIADTAADCEGIVNFCTEDIDIGGKTLSADLFCSRVAGLIVGTPMSIACTYAPLPEVRDIKRLTQTQADAAVNAGKLILIHDGVKVKVGRGVTSLTTVTLDKTESLKKIKVTQTVDIINSNLRELMQDNYIGKVSNNYDNKLLLLTAVKEYLVGLEAEGVLESNASTVEIDIAANEAFLKSKGINTADMSEQEIKEANTGDKLFLVASISILDAIENISLNISI